MQMATGAVPAMFYATKSTDSGLSFARGMGFVRISDVKRSKSQRRVVSVIRNSNTSSETVEVQPASEGSTLLGKTSNFKYWPFELKEF